MLVSISDLRFRQKPEGKDIGKVNNSLRPKDVTVAELATAIGEGCSFCPSVFRKNVRRNENFMGASCITLDIDHCQKPLEEAIQGISTTIAYPTFSNGADGKYSYRLLIRLDNDLCSLDDYTRYATILATMLKDNVGIEVDHTCTQGTRMYFGTNSTVCISEAKYNYTKVELEDWWTSAYGNIPIATFDSIDNMAMSNVDRTSLVYKLLREGKTDKEIIYRCLARGYKPIYSTTIEWLEEEETRLVPDYIQINRKWEFDKNGKHIPHKWEQKQGGRHIRFYKTLSIKKQIKPSIRYDELLFNAIYERYYFYDNSDNKLSNYWILSIIPYILNQNHIHFQTSAKLKCNTEYLKQLGKSYQKATAEVKHKMLVDAVLPLYNKEFTIKENLEALQTKGLKLSLRTLKTILREVGISKSRKK